MFIYKTPARGHAPWQHVGSVGREGKRDAVLHVEFAADCVTESEDWIPSPAAPAFVGRGLEICHGMRAMIARKKNRVDMYMFVCLCCE